jgi:hypothetical protein
MLIASVENHESEKPCPRGININHKRRYAADRSIVPQLYSLDHLEYQSSRGSEHCTHATSNLDSRAGVL